MPDARIRQIPGIGPVVATTIGNDAAFRKGRDFAAWLGIVPCQYSTGGKAKLLGISKRGNVYLRKILIHGARAACCVLNVTEHRSAPGSTHFMPELPKTLLWPRWQTNSLESRGMFCRVVKTAKTNSQNDVPEF